MKLIQELGKEVRNAVGNILNPMNQDSNAGVVDNILTRLTPLIDLPEGTFKAAVRGLGYNSVSEMVGEIKGELEANKTVCNAIEGDEFTLPISVLPNLTVCLSPKQLSYFTRPSNYSEIGRMALSCGLEGNISEPGDFLLSLAGGGFQEKMLGWLTGLALGEGAPALLNPVGLVTFPFTFATCVQAQIAKEMGDLNKEDLTRLQDEVRKFTNRDEGPINAIFENIGL